uniref:myeloid-associated differentiation marker homolog n=1 Tax=Ciona intestinalis TaxID=7719 RepID=UPI00052195CD|nr:myeloid-associated differentiation marker homolog [Ciona intestinalis]|eukprot:XP_009859527.1 myeloid-associated differentiation marker homolog [Ciona intestinalis]
MKSKLEYVTSPEGIVRAIIIVCGCIAFALIADSGHGDVVDWVLAAYIIAWCCSLLSYFFIATTLASKMECGVSYEAVDFCISVFSFFDCLMASIVLPMYTGSRQDERIAACVFGFILTILYAVEIYLTKENAPDSMNYLLKKEGILKACICVLGCTTFALLDAAGYECFSPSDGCDSARKWSLAAFIISWGISVIFLLLNLTGLGAKIGSMFNTADFIWSAFSFVNYLIAAIVLACYLKCPSFDHYACQARLASDIFGFITAILYAVEAFFLKNAENPTDVTPKE